MESIYDPKGFRSSEHFPVKEYFDKYSELCCFSNLQIKGTGGYKYRDKLQQEICLDISNEDMKMLEESCSVSKLTLEDEPKDLPMDIPDKLQTKSKLDAIYPVNHNARQLNVIASKEALHDKLNVQSTCKFGNKRFLKTMTVTSNKSSLYDITPGSNFIYTIIVYRPYAIGYGGGNKNSTDKLRFAYEIEALGTNTLADIADSIPCSANIALFKEVENTKVDLGPFMDAKEHYPSQSIFIDGVFYNDSRSPRAIDYSHGIIEWAIEKNIGKFDSAVMEETMLNTLKPMLGYPYVYMHQGSCEHIFTFSDARLIQEGDCLYSKKYPRIVSLCRPSNVLCFMCSVTHSQWIVVKCKIFPHEKVFLCTECCNSYLYVDGKKVTNFNLYPYYDQELLTRHLSEANIVQ